MDKDPDIEIPAPTTLDVESSVEQSDSDTNDLGYDEPRCSWLPTEDSHQDCGEGLICPPCD